MQIHVQITFGMNRSVRGVMKKRNENGERGTDGKGGWGPGRGLWIENTCRIMVHV